MAETRGLSIPEGLKQATVNGVDLAYEDVGTGPPVVFVHGSCNDLTFWFRQVPAFSKKFRVITFSRRFCWPNRDITDGADDPIDAHADDLVELVRALDLGPAHLIGNSSGGSVCVLAALSAPSLVKSLTLAEPALLSLFVSTPPRPHEILKLFLTRPSTAMALIQFATRAIAPASKLFKRDDIDNGVAAFIRGVLGDEVYDSLPSDRKDHLRVNGKSMKAQLVGKGGIADVTAAQLRGITLPTLLMKGEQSPPIMRKIVDYMAVLMPKATLVEIRGASHNMNLQQPEATNDALLHFLSANQ